ncbi:Hypothetical predicted protein [Mytilus galloprovincialis]|uniref:Uncharacterized protein n=1 Tax=Mytilus galloprovincialis TaxID=29158 RepID=A0A8B6C9Y5_MYTGA|nr:Hypothetical predicted protein [Mytilus galloprovincialis]
MLASFKSYDAQRQGIAAFDVDSTKHNERGKGKKKERGEGKKEKGKKKGEGRGREKKKGKASLFILKSLCFKGQDDSCEKN